MTTEFESLPPCNQYGNYWLGKPGNPPAVLPIRCGDDLGSFMALTSDGFMFQPGGRLKAFRTPYDALRAIRIREAIAAQGTTEGRG